MLYMYTPIYVPVRKRGVMAADQWLECLVVPHTHYQTAIHTFTTPPHHQAVMVEKHEGE